MAAMVNGSETLPVRVLLVDDEALMRAGLRMMIDGVHAIEVVGEAADGRIALEQIRALSPDVVLMDIRMPRMTGLEAMHELAALGTGVQVVMLTAFDTDEFLLQALRAGAAGFLLKDSPPEEVVRAVLDAAAGRPRFSPDVLARLVRLAASREGDAVPSVAPRSSPAGSGTASPSPGADSASADRSVPGDGPATAPEGITEREWEVARLVAQGLANIGVGERLFMSVATVKTHLGRLYQKLRVTNRVQLAIRVLELGGRAHRPRSGRPGCTR